MTTMIPATNVMSPHVDGVLPAELDGYFLQACQHPAGGLGRRPMLSGLRLSGGTARWYREATDGRPAEDLGRDCALNDAPPGIRPVAVTEHYVVVLDLPVTYNRAADLLGAEVPYAWQANRSARIGLLPLRSAPEATPHWFTIEPCLVFHAANAYEDGSTVVLDAVRHDVDGARQAGLYRWEMDLATGRVRQRLLAGAADEATVDTRVSGRRHRYVFSSTVDSATIVRHDLTTWHTQERSLGIGLRTGRPVFVPRAGIEEGAGWLLVLVEDPVHRRGALLVLNALDLTAPPQAIVHIPGRLPASRLATWVAAV